MSTLRAYHGPAPGRVTDHYGEMHRRQTVDFARETRARFDPAAGGCREELSILEAIDRFEFVDASDPDFEEDNLLHCYQTAEACRAAFPDREWMHLVGFLHDLGKASLARAGLPQWAVAGDIFPLGCRFDESNVHRESFADNPDASDRRYRTPLGIYAEGVGFEQLLFAYGHDQYLYDVLSAHEACRIPAAGLYVIRFHSFHAWHDRGGYAALAGECDRAMLPLLRAFRGCDLYSKTGELPRPELLRPYYEELVERWCPGTLRW